MWPIREPGLLGAVIVFRDMTEIRAREKDLQLAATVFENSPYGITVTDGKARILRVNPAFTAITGFREDEIAGKTPAVLKSGVHQADFYQAMWHALETTGEWKGELQNRRKDGNVYPEWLSVRAVKGAQGEITNYVGIFSDLSEHKESERRLEYLANYDTLTGLPNRVLFQDRLNQALAHMTRGNRVLALMYAGLDHFKIINESLGVDVGDALLKAVAGRLLAVLRESDTVCRLGGDQFAILLDDVRSAADVASKAQALLDEFEAPFDVGGPRAVHHAEHRHHAGAARCRRRRDAPAQRRHRDVRRQGTRPQYLEVLQRRHVGAHEGIAAHRERAAARDRCRRTHAALPAAVVHRAAAASCASNRCCAGTPPNSAPCRAVGLHPHRREVRPDRADRRMGAAQGLRPDRRLAGRRHRRACAWRSTCRRVQFRQTDLVDLVRRTLTEYRIEDRAPRTGNHRRRRHGRRRALHRHAERPARAGLRDPVDDFGTGYSSLNYLKQFPDQYAEDRPVLRARAGQAIPTTTPW